MSGSDGSLGRTQGPGGRRERLCALVAALGVLASMPACSSSPTVPRARSGELPAIPAVDESRVPADLSAAYRVDAARFALRVRAERSVRPGQRSVEFRPAEVEPFHRALLWIFLFQHPARDSVVELREIHTFPRPRVQELAVGVESDARWPDAWREGTLFTGNKAVDRLIRRFDLALIAYRDLRTMSFDIAVLRTAEPLDIAALGTRFEGIEGIHSAGPNTVAGDANDIRAVVEDSAIRLEYSVGFGDCPAGCIGRHIWSFRVHEDGEVEFVGISGSPLPDG